MFDFLKLSLLLLGGLCIFSAAQDECPEDVCADPKPCVDENGKILLTVWYDNDDVNDSAQWSANMIRKACDAINTFPADKFSVEFIPGAGTRIGENNELICKSDCNEDRLEGCAALILNDCSKFNSFVCCNNTTGSAQDCIQGLGIDPSEMVDCAENGDSDQYLMDNGEKRRNAGIPGCHVPEFSFNNIVDRCIKIPTSDKLKEAICDIFGEGDVSIEAC